jgi:hypothetical protein
MNNIPSPEAFDRKKLASKLSEFPCQQLLVSSHNSVSLAQSTSVRNCGDINLAPVASQSAHAQTRYVSSTTGNITIATAIQLASIAG